MMMLVFVYTTTRRRQELLKKKNKNKTKQRYGVLRKTMQKKESWRGPQTNNGVAYFLL
jgi:hypothetical protein